MSETLLKILKELEELRSFDFSTDDLATICRYCATDESSKTNLDNCEKPLNVIKTLLNIALEGRADDDKTEPDLRRGRLALRTLINICNRSSKFKKSVSADLVPLCRCIIRISELQIESCALLVALADELHKVALLHKDYPGLLTDLTSLWYIMDDNSWITAYFLCILETIHPNNVLYCVDLIERLLYDIGESSTENMTQIPELLVLVIDIVGNCALRPIEYRNQLYSTPRAVIHIIDVLEAVLDAQAIVEAQEAVENPRVKYHDRPDIPVSCRIPRVQNDKRLIALSSLLVPLNEVRGIIKCAAVRCIGNLCCDNPENQRAAGQHGGVIAVLRCTKKRPEDKPFIMQWAIASLRYMIISCPENQDIIVSIDEQPSGILDRDKLLKELGVEIIKDEGSGKFKVKRVLQ